MQSLQIRLPEEIVKQVDKLVHQGFFSSRSDLLKEAVRKYVLEFNYAGSLPYIVGPFTPKELETLKNDPSESLKASNEEMKKVRTLIKSLRID